MDLLLRTEICKSSGRIAAALDTKAAAKHARVSFIVAGRASELELESGYCDATNERHLVKRYLSFTAAFLKSIEL